MGTTPTENAESHIRTQAAKVAAAVEYAARSPLGETETLGFFEGLTSKGFRLVWEDGVLLLVAYSEHPLDSTLVADIGRRLRWVENNRALVQERLRTVIGPDTIRPHCTVRVVVNGTNDADEVELAKLAPHVELISFEFKSSADSVSLSPRRKSLPQPSASQKQLTPSAMSADAPLSLEAMSTPERYLLELRRTLDDAGHWNRWIDPADWRCSPTLNLVRVYGLLVTIAASFTVPSSLKKKPAVTSRLGATKNMQGEAISAKVYGFLGRFADAVAKEQFHSKGLTPVLAEVTALVDEHLQHRAMANQGAYLGPAWKSPVPPQISSLISCMGGPTTLTQRADALAAATGMTAKLLEATNFAIASSVHVAQTFDDRRWPAPPIDRDQRYLQGALLRVLAGHRLLLELVGRKPQAARLAMLGLAEEISLQTTFAVFWTSLTDADKQSQEYLNTVRRGAIEVLSGAGRVSGVGRAASVLRDIAPFHEEPVLSAMKAVNRIGRG
jgi:hypothetical protein